jgi:hypothetical protein
MWEEVDAAMVGRPGVLSKWGHGVDAPGVVPGGGGQPVVGPMTARLAGRLQGGSWALKRGAAPRAAGRALVPSAPARGGRASGRMRPLGRALACEFGASQSESTFLGAS